MLFVIIVVVFVVVMIDNIVYNVKYIDYLKFEFLYYFSIYDIGGFICNFKK